MKSNKQKKILLIIGFHETIDFRRQLDCIGDFSIIRNIVNKK